MRTILACLFLVLTSGLANAQSHANLVHAELLADTTAITAGKPFTIGLHLTIEKGWHIYWSNPGDAGTPTSVKITAPPGWKVGPVQYPVPVDFSTESVRGYGYEDQTMLLVEVTPPADAHGTTSFSADVKWLVCKDVCVPGKATVTLELPAGAPERAHAELFDKYAPMVPVKESDAIRVLSAHVDGDTLTVTVQAAGGATALQWFPGTMKEADIDSVTIADAGSGKSTIQMKVRVLAGVKVQQKALDSVIAYTDANGVRHGLTLQTPMPGV